MSTPASRQSDRTVNQLVALAFGVVYVLVALMGFFVSETVAGTDDDKLLGLFEVNHLHNLAHLAIGIALAASSRALGSARVANQVVGAAYLLLGILGLFILDSDINILALNHADNGLHFASAGLLLLVGLYADRDRRSATAG